MNNSIYCSPCSPVARIPLVITQEEEDDDEDDECEIVENEKENVDGSPVCVQVSDLKPAVRKLLSIPGKAGRQAFGGSKRFVPDPLAIINRRLFLTPKEKVSRKRKAAVTETVPVVSPELHQDSLKWISIIGSNRLKKDDSTLLLKMDALITFLDNNFVCKHCVKSD